MEDAKEDSKEWRLYLACRQGERSNVLKLFKDENADPTSKDTTNISTGGTALHWASYHGWLDIVQEFVEKYKMNPKLASKYDETPLHNAYHGGHVDIVRYLVSENGCNVEIQIADQHCPLHYACQYGHPEIVQFFLDKLNMNADIRDKDKRSPLHFVAQYGHLDIVKYIVARHGCAPLVGDGDNRTPLHNACSNGYKGIVAYLISERKCDPEVRDAKDWTPLHCAWVTATISDENSLELIQYLVNEGKCGITKVNEQGNNSLHLACISGKTSVVKFLCTLPSCDPRMENHFGTDAMSLTLKPDIHKILTQKTATTAAVSSSNVYRFQGRVLGTSQPLQPSVKVFVVRNPSAGKSTLTAALQKEAFNVEKRVSEVDEKTAGVIPHEFESKKTVESPYTILLVIRNSTTVMQLSFRMLFSIPLPSSF